MMWERLVREYPSTTGWLAGLVLLEVAHFLYDVVLG